MDKKKLTQRSFTLIELFVVTSIIILLSGVVLANYRSGQGQLALQRSASKLAQDIRKAQEMAMSAKECSIDKCGGSQPIIPQGGYGVFFDKYVSVGEANYDIYIYADTDGDEKKSLSDPNIETIYKESEGVYIEKEVKIKEVSVNAVVSDKISINFKPPDPTTSISGGNLASITLSLENDSTKTKSIKINKAGLIYVE